MTTLAGQFIARGWLRLALLGALAPLSWGAAAQDLQPVPALTAHVMDRTGTLGPAQLAAIEAKLVALEAAKGSQVVVLMLATTQPEDVASFAFRVGDAWKIGRKGVGDGLLILVAKDDRKVRIEVAKTLEGAVPDLLAKRIIDQAITPRFKQGDYAGGIDAGVDQISAAIKGEALPEVAAAHSGSGSVFDLLGLDWTSIAIFMFFLVPVVGALARSIFGRGLGSLITGGGIGSLLFFMTTSIWIGVLVGVGALLFALLSGTTLSTGRGGRGPRGGGFGGGGGGGFSGGGGGGFGSGGGGDFGGGGASGSW